MQSNIDRRRTIWVVDDSATDAARVRQLLNTEFDVKILSDGAAALERLSSEVPPDLLILDWMMPEISGPEVCRYIRSSPGRLRQTPIILLTARHGSQEVLEAFESGANDYIAKPYVNAELIARVRALVSSKRHLERAENAEADVRVLLAKAPDPIFAVDAQGNVSFANEEALRILNRPQGEVIGESLQSLLPGLATNYVEAASGEPLLPLPDVEIGDRIFSPSIRILPSDSASATTISLRDVTSRRQSEARKLDFYSIIAHDLRTPINSVLLRLQLAAHGAHGVLPAGLITDIRQAESSLKSLVGMINDFLELAKLEGVGYKIEKDTLDIDKLLCDTMEDFRPLLQKSQLAWKHSQTKDGLTLLGDGRRLVQVLSNLIGNAIKFTPPNGTIATSIVEAGEHVEISVEDTGRGIERAAIPYLFDRFTRTSQGYADTPGTGLGLMIVREIVEAHGGVIGVESEPDVGSRFWFRLPRNLPSAQGMGAETGL